MKRKHFLIFTLLCSMFVFMVTSASALTMSSGSLNILNLPDNASIHDYRYGTTYTDPDTGEDVSVDTLFGFVTSYNTDDSTRLYYVAGALDPNNDYKGEQSYSQTSITGQFHQDTGGAEYTTSAQTTSTNLEARSDIGFNSSLQFTGVLSDFGYAYSFTGSKDSDDDFLRYIVQMEIAYYDATIENSRERWVKVYSDYYITSDEFDARNNWIYVSDAESGETYSGSRTFDYSQYGEQRWSVRYNFGGGGYDNADYIEPVNTNTTVPEPTGILLLGMGLIGLTGVLREKY